MIKYRGSLLPMMAVLYLCTPADCFTSHPVSFKRGTTCRSSRCMKAGKGFGAPSSQSGGKTKSRAPRKGEGQCEKYCLRNPAHKDYPSKFVEYRVEVDVSCCLSYVVYPYTLPLRHRSFRGGRRGGGKLAMFSNINIGFRFGSRFGNPSSLTA